MRVEYIAGKRAGTSADVDEPTAQMLIDSGRARAAVNNGPAEGVDMEGGSEGAPAPRVKRKYTRRTPPATTSTE